MKDERSLKKDIDTQENDYFYSSFAPLREKNKQMQ